MKLLRLASLAFILMGAYMLFDAYRAFAWAPRLAEGGTSYYDRALIQDEVLRGAPERSRSATESERIGLLLLAAGLIMGGLASVIKTLKNQRAIPAAEVRPEIVRARP